MARPEGALQIVVAGYLDYALPPDAVWTSVDAGAHKLSAKQADYARRRGIKPGWPDVLILWRGTLIGIELKAPKGRLSTRQIVFAASMLAAGGKWFVARSIAEIEQQLRGYGMPLRATTGTKFEART